MSRRNANVLRIRTDKAKRAGTSELTREYWSYAPAREGRTEVIFDEVHWEHGPRISVQRGTYRAPDIMGYSENNLTVHLETRWAHMQRVEENGRLRYRHEERKVETDLLDINTDKVVKLLQAGKQVTFVMQVTDPVTGEVMPAEASDPLLTLASTE